MSALETPQSVGVVTPQIASFKEPLALDCGQVLGSHELIFETYGTLNKQKNNAVLAVSYTHLTLPTIYSV